MLQKYLIILSACAATIYLFQSTGGLYPASAMGCSLTEQTYQVLAGHLTDSHHPDCVWGNRLVVEGCVHEGTGAGGRSLVVFGRHRIMGLQEGL